MKLTKYFLLSFISVMLAAFDTAQGQDTVKKVKTVYEIRKMLLGKWVDIKDSTYKILITKDSIYELRPNLQGEIPHSRIDHYEITTLHCGASFVKSKTGFYIIKYGTESGLDSKGRSFNSPSVGCLPIQYISENMLQLYQSHRDAEGYTPNLELNFKRCK